MFGLPQLRLLGVTPRRSGTSVWSEAPTAVSWGSPWTRSLVVVHGVRSGYHSRACRALYCTVHLVSCSHRTHQGSARAERMRCTATPPGREGGRRLCPGRWMWCRPGNVLARSRCRGGHRPFRFLAGARGMLVGQVVGCRVPGRTLFTSTPSSAPSRPQFPPPGWAKDSQQTGDGYASPLDSRIGLEFVSNIEIRAAALTVLCDEWIGIVLMCSARTCLHDVMSIGSLS